MLSVVIWKLEMNLENKLRVEKQQFEYRAKGMSAERKGRWQQV